MLRHFLPVPNVGNDEIETAHDNHGQLIYSYSYSFLIKYLKFSSSEIRLNKSKYLDLLANRNIKQIQT
jgi:hypothetical protein